jgi:signal transduction histidine kinase
VIDTGVGIREEDQANLFIAFGKGNSDENKYLNR